MMRALGVYREAEFSPAKVEHDAAILDAVLAELKRHGVEVSAISAARLVDDPPAGTDLVLAMCQGERALGRLVALEQQGAIAVNSALAIRNCYRDLLCAGLVHAGVPVPTGALVRTGSRPPDLSPLGVLDLDAPMFVKRGDLHALAPDDVQRVESRGALRSALAGMAERGVTIAYVQQAVEGRVVKFYGVSGGEYFAALDEEGGKGEQGSEQSLMSDQLRLELARSAAAAATTLGLETWGGDAVIDGERFMMIDFNDWPSFSRVREAAARAIARRCLMLARRPRQGV
jgi:glutathione synthase/RimK-type ligase-like ATP-grasp enzyme